MSASGPTPPPAVLWITRTLEEAGHETWAVGGAVRDALLGLDPGDWDLTTAAPPGRVRRLFPRTVPVGIEHGTVGVLARDGRMYEVTTFRRDVETFGRRAVVAFADSVDEDLARRDFTINAIAWHPLRREFRDPWDGRLDLRARRLRTVGPPSERFAEDWLRVLRALRFAARFELTIDPGTWRAIVESPPFLDGLSPERIREELLKILSAPRPSSALRLYHQSGVLEALHPLLAGLSGVPHPDTAADLWEWSLRTCDALSPRRPMLRVAALLQGAGVPDARPGEPADLRARGVTRALVFLEGLRFSNAQIREISGLVDAALWPPPSDAEEGALRQWLHRTGREMQPSLARLWIAADRTAEGGWTPRLPLIRRLRRILQGGAPLTTAELAIDGRALMRLGMRPGPGVGRILRSLMDEVLSDPTRNTPGQLEARAREWIQREGAGP